ncbi:pentatricopeptide repeat-containing protein At1g07740, mitochondrial isoform X1 [Prosopis cineraria]|uniref:pentatricopeptide repeat-containing protein At1g07740, mitochondrial isoform X1 n=2 Tax=Prosopis cineraria TaxID=364024 RepID=UPI0024101726|nr:pentatricopeptide repeat-containing protein At1g07740, mitochondrial isoform X1 [Prosopis cineraria]
MQAINVLLTSNGMIFSREKAINPTRYSNQTLSQLFRTLHTKNFQAIPCHERPRIVNSKSRKRIPFITQVKELHDPEEAISLFHECKRQGVKHDYPSYAALLYKLARSRSFEAVETVLAYIQDRGIHCKETIFVALFQHYSKAKLPEEAVKLFNRMPQFNCIRTLQSFNALLNTLIDNDCFTEANDTFKGSYKMGFRPNTVSFNLMIKGWLAIDEFDKACDVFDEMLEKKVQPSVVTYNSLIGFLSRKGEIGKAMTLLEDMTKKGKYPSKVTYALLMESFCSMDKYEEAKKLMFDMAYRGCKPQPINFSVLMNDLGKRGKIEEAKSLLHEMRKRRLKPDVVIYNILINYLCKEGKTEEAYKVLIEMQIKGCEPNAATYRMMVDGFCKTGDFDGGLNILNVMLASKHYPRSETFNCLVVGLLNCGKSDGGCFVLEEMEKRKPYACFSQVQMPFSFPFICLRFAAKSKARPTSQVIQLPMPSLKLPIFH